MTTPSINTEVFLDPKQTIGNILPTIFIDRITLESSVGSPPIERNPHIDWDQSQLPGRTEDRDPQAQNVQTFIANQEPESLKVTVNLVAKDRIINQRSSWFGNFDIDLKDYIHIHFVQTTTQAATNFWANQFNSTSNFPTSEENQAWRGTTIQSFSLKDFGGNNDPVSTENVGLEESPSLRTKYVETDSQGNRILNMTHVLDGNSGKTFGNRTKPEINGNTNHLSYFVWASFATTKLALDFGIDPDTLNELMTRNNLNFMSKVSSDTAIRNGKTVTEAFVFLRRDNNQLWTGPVHYHDETNPVDTTGDGVRDYIGYMAGATHITGLPPLIKKNVKNNTVNDLRAAKRISKLNLDFSILEKELLTNITKNVKIDTSLVRSSDSYFTEMSLSRDFMGHASFIFGVDMRKIVRDNSTYGKLFAEKSAHLNDIMNYIQVLSMKIYRVRLEGSSAQGGDIAEKSSKNQFLTKSKPRKFGEYGIAQNPPMVGDFDARSNSAFIRNESDELVVSYSNIDGSEKSTSAYEFDSTPNTLGEVNNIYSGIDNPNGVKYYSGLDFSIAGKTDGYYVYRVEMEVHDGTVDFLKSKLTSLTKAKEQLLEYYNIGTQIGITGLAQPKRNETIEQNMQTNAMGSATYFDPIANRFTEDFIRYCADHYPTAERAPWNKATSTYINTIKLFTNFNTEQINELTTAFTNYINPISGNPQGITRVLELMSNLEDRIGSALTTNDNYTAKKQETQGKPFTTDPATQGKNYKSIKVQFQFDESFNSNVPKRVGYNFLLGRSFRLDPSRTISSEDFQRNVSHETHRLWSGSPDVTLESINVPFASIEQTDFSYFTPTGVQYGANRVFDNLLERGSANNPDLNDYENADLTALFLSSQNPEYGLSKSSRQPEPSEGYGQTSVLNPNADILSDFVSQNLSVSTVLDNEVSLPNVLPSDVSTHEPYSDPDPLFNYNTDSLSKTKVDGTAYPILQEITFKFVGSQAKHGELTIPVSAPTTKGLTFYDPSSPTGFMNGLEDATTQIRNLPNQIKALLKWNDNSGKNVNAPTSTFTQEVRDFLQLDPFTSRENSSKARYMFKLIYKLEVLTGYEKVKYQNSQESSLRRPVWRTLTRQIFEQARDGLLLCRLRPYENKQFGIYSTPNLNLPTLNECFFIQGDGAFVNNLQESIDVEVPMPELSLADNQPSYQYTIEPAVSTSPLVGETVTAAPATTSATSASPGAVGGRITANSFRPAPEQTAPTNTNISGPSDGTTSTSAGNVSFGQGSSGNSSGGGFGGY